MKKNIIYLLLIIFSTFLNANEKVVLQLKWFHQFQFAGYYAAKEKGFYDEVGLDVEIKQRDLKYNNIDEVINGNAQYGVADSILILYRLKQQPVVIVSPIFQHSPSVFISLKKKNISSIYELNNKDILFYPNNTDGFSLLAMIKKFNLDVNLVRERYKDDYMRLINNEVDVMPAYIANEPFLFKEKGYDEILAKLPLMIGSKEVLEEAKDYGIEEEEAIENLITYLEEEENINLLKTSKIRVDF